MLGYEPDGEGIQSREEWFALIHPDDRAATRELALALESGAADGYVNEYRMLAADGSWRWVLSRGKSIACSERVGRSASSVLPPTSPNARALKLRCARAKRGSGDWRIRRRC